MGFAQQNHASACPRKEIRIADILARCEGAYSTSTLSGYANDLQQFRSWCQSRRQSWLPASDHTIARFIDDQIELLSSATVRRRLSAIKFAHKMCDLPDPAATSAVYLALRRAARRKHRRPAQSKGLTAGILQAIVRGQPDTLAGLRNAALIAVGYDTLCRSSELAAMTTDHLRRNDDRCWSVIIPRSKGDPAGDGRTAWLSPQTVDQLQKWLAASGIQDGPLFRGLNLARVAPGHLDTSSIRKLIKRASEVAGIDRSIARQLSGHSMRVGGAQDMLVAGFDALAIMQAGGWKSTNVLLRYVENAETRSLHERRWQSLGQSIGSSPFASDRYETRSTR